MHKKLQDPRFIGFVLGFGGIALIGMLLIVSWTVFKTTPSPTLAPSAVPISEHPTDVAPENGPAPATPLPGAGGLIPATTSAVATGPSPTPTRSEPIDYTVRAGDTLFDIALAYGVSVETIRAANNLERDHRRRSSVDNPTRAAAHAHTLRRSWCAHSYGVQRRDPDRNRRPL
jgi:LysM repeat protein